MTLVNPAKIRAGKRVCSSTTTSRTDSLSCMCVIASLMQARQLKILS